MINARERGKAQTGGGGELVNLGKNGQHSGVVSEAISRVRGCLDATLLSFGGGERDGRVFVLVQAGGGV